MKRGENKFYKKTLIIILFLAIGSVMFLFSDKTAQGAVTIGGDIYSGGNLGNNITVSNNSVASASGNVDVLGTNYKISGIQPKRLTDLIKYSTVKPIVDRLRTLNVQDAQKVSNSSSNFSLNTNGFPEGTVWYKGGDLNIGNLTFSGKGTIIVENGDLTINNNIECDSTASVGFIVIGRNKDDTEKGNITIDNNVQNLCGAYFATGTITIY